MIYQKSATIGAFLILDLYTICVVQCHTGGSMKNFVGYGFVMAAMALCFQLFVTNEKFKQMSNGMYWTVLGLCLIGVILIIWPDHKENLHSDARKIRR